MWLREAIKDWSRFRLGARATRSPPSTAAPKRWPDGRCSFASGPKSPVPSTSAACLERLRHHGHPDGNRWQDAARRERAVSLEGSARRRRWRRGGCDARDIRAIGRAARRARVEALTGIHFAAGKISLTITGSTLLANATGSTSALMTRHSVVATTTTSAPHDEALAWCPDRRRMGTTRTCYVSTRRWLRPSSGASFGVRSWRTRVLGVRASAQERRSWWVEPSSVNEDRAGRGGLGRSAIGHRQMSLSRKRNLK